MGASNGAGAKGGYETLELSQEGPVLWIALDRPDRRNAINWQMHRDIQGAFQDAEEDDSVRVIVLRGNGPCFSAGHDLYEVAEDYLSGSFVMRPLKRTREEPPEFVLREISKPIIAAVHGFLGPQAVHTALGADLVFAAEGTILSFEQMRAGGAGINPLIPLMIGEKKTKEWQLLGKALTAEEAERYGLVNRVVPAAQLLDEVRRCAEEIAAMPPQNVAANKAAINMVMNVLGARVLRQIGWIYGSLGHGSDFDKSFFATAREHGLKQALEMRDAAHGGREASGMKYRTSR
jgi:enoyl-CoA hydratase/carnithine racemase